MGRKSPYNGVKLKVKKIPIDLEQLFTEISTAYGNSEQKEIFIALFKTMCSNINGVHTHIVEQCNTKLKPRHYHCKETNFKS